MSESALKSFLSGGVGGICVVFVGHPLDLIKVRMQTGTASSSSSSVLGMLASTFRKEGIRGLYRGVSAPLLAVSPMYAVSFWGYDMGKRIVGRITGGGNNRPLTVAETCAAGGLSAIPTTAIMAPSERLKCLLQVANQSNTTTNTTNTAPKYTGMLDCARQVYKEGGIRSLFKGTGATLIRDIPGSIAYFGAYEVLKRELMRLQGIDTTTTTGTTTLSPVAILTAGGLAGMACWAVSIPPDVIKSRYQTAPDGMYNGLYDVYKTLMKEEGPKALFTGMRPAMIRAFPANAAGFMGMELARSMFAFLD